MRIPVRRHLATVEESWRAWAIRPQTRDADTWEVFSVDDGLARAHGSLKAMVMWLKLHIQETVFPSD